MNHEGKKLFDKFLLENQLRTHSSYDIEKRREVFLVNYRTAKMHTLQESRSSSMKLNQFADWFEIEYRDILKLKSTSNKGI